MPQIIFELPCIIENGIRNGSAQKRYLLAVNGGGMGGGALNSNVSEIGEAEQFTFCFDVASNGEMVAKIKTCEGRFLKVKVFSNPDPQNTKPVHADAITPSTWEQFTLCLLDNGKYALRTYTGHYLTARNASAENDPVIALVADDIEASWFAVIPQSYQNPVSLPSTKRRDYQMASTDFEETRYYIEEYIRALRGHDIQDANLLLTGGRLHIWAGPDYINGIVMEFPELGLMLGEAGIAEGEVKESVFNLGSDENKRVKDFIGSVTVGEHDGRIVTLILHTQFGQRLCEFICPAFAGTEAELAATSYKIAPPYGIIGLIPSFDRGERNAIKKLELLFGTETEHDAFFPFYKVEYCSDKLLNIKVKDQGENMYLAYNQEKLNCKSGSVNILGNPKMQAIDGILCMNCRLRKVEPPPSFMVRLPQRLNLRIFRRALFWRCWERITFIWNVNLVTTILLLTRGTVFIILPTTNRKAAPLLLFLAERRRRPVALKYSIWPTALMKQQNFAV